MSKLLGSKLSTNSDDDSIDYAFTKVNTEAIEDWASDENLLRVGCGDEETKTAVEEKEKVETEEEEEVEEEEEEEEKEEVGEEDEEEEEEVGEEDEDEEEEEDEDEEEVEEKFAEEEMEMLNVIFPGMSISDILKTDGEFNFEHIGVKFDALKRKKLAWKLKRAQDKQRKLQSRQKRIEASKTFEAYNKIKEKQQKEEQNIQKIQEELAKVAKKSKKEVVTDEAEFVPTYAELDDKSDDLDTKANVTALETLLGLGEQVHNVEEAKSSVSRRDNAWSSGAWLENDLDDIIATAAFALSNTENPRQLARVLSRSMCSAFHDIGLEHSKLPVAEIAKAALQAGSRNKSTMGIKARLDVVVNSSATEGQVIPSLVRDIHSAASSMNHPDLKVGERIPHVDVFARCKDHHLMGLAAVLNLSALALSEEGNSRECAKLRETTAAYLSHLADEKFQ